MQFHVYSNPIEIMKYFESQVDNMLKSFMFGFNNEGTLFVFMYAHDTLLNFNID